MNELMERPGFLPDVQDLIDKQLLAESYRYDAQEFLRFIEGAGAGILEPEGWIGYQRSLEKVRNGRRLSARTINRKTAAAKALVRFVWKATGDHSAQAEKRFELAMSTLRTKKVTRTQIQPIGPEEARAMIAKALEPIHGLGAHRRARPELALMIEFLWSTGCRVSELVNILLTDIKPLDRQRYTISLQGKGDKERQVPASRELVDRIRRHFRSELYLFESRGGPRCRPDGRYSRECISTLIHRCALATIGRGFGAHNLRHSFATHYYQATQDLYGLQQLLGHSNVSTTAGTYVHGRVDFQRTTEVMKL